MISKAGFNQRNVTIVALSLTVGIGFTSGTEADIWHIFPQIIQDVLLEIALLLFLLFQLF